VDVRRRDRLLIPALAVGCFVLALLQRPGWAVSDTKIDLHVDPGRFLADAAAPWTTDISLGHVQSGQYGGYLWPMGPFFAVLRELGLSPWLVERLWLGTLFFLGAWGVVKLLDALLDRQRGLAHVVAACAYTLNPYVVTYTDRVSVTLLAYAALPWLLLIVHRGVRERGWLWPALFALIVTSSGGGINAAVTAWALVAPLALLLYEPALRFVSWRDAWTFAWRTALLGAITSLWWVVPLAVQSKWGLPFLPYTEQPGTIWGSTSASESLRLMGFWLSYAGVGFGSALHPYTDDATPYLFWAPAIIGSLLLPALALGGFGWTRRWRYAPFFLGLVLLGVLIMMAGFPEGTPLRKGVTFAYNHLVSLQTLRTTYKAGPLPALGLAVLGGLAASAAWGWLSARRAAWRPIVLVAAAAVLVFSAWPFFKGDGVDKQLTWKSIPAAWTDVSDDLDQSLGDDHRAMVLPGQLFSYYTWGGTVDPILPTLSDKPVAVRQVVPFADLRSVDLQWSTDALISQQRVIGPQLTRLLDLQSVGSVVTATDDDRDRSGALDPNAAARELRLAGLDEPDATYGPTTAQPAQNGDLAPTLDLPQVRRQDLPARSMVQLVPRDRAAVVDGSAGGIVDWAAFGALPEGEALRYAADLTPHEIQTYAAAGGPIVISDSNRRRVFVPSQLRANLGATLSPDDPISADGHQLNPWPDRSTDVQTVAQLTGVRYLRAPFSPQVPQFPEHRPFAAMDGDPQTAWLADRTLTADRWYLDVGLDHRMDVPTIDLTPYGDERGRVKEVAVNGKRFKVHEGRNRLPVDLHDVDALRISMVDITDPPPGVDGGAGGIRELSIPGVHVTEALRPPTVVESALRGADLQRTPLTYLFERTRGSDPYHQDTIHGPWSAGYAGDEGDAETGLQRIIDPPATRTWALRAWTSVADDAPDHALDELVGGRVPGEFDSSSRYEGLPIRRASSAFDTDTNTAWVGGWGGSAGATAWLSWTTPQPRTVRAFRFVAPAEVVRHPTRVRLEVDGKPGPAVAVGAGGTVTLPAPVTGSRFRLDVLSAAFPHGARGPALGRDAVGIAEVRGAGIPRVAPRRSGRFDSTCSLTVDVGQAQTELRTTGTVADFDAGRPLPARGCSTIALRAGQQRLSVPGTGPLRVDLLKMTSAPREPAPAVGSAGKVTSTGTAGRGTRDDVRVDVTQPAWIVLGESFTTGWRATCDGRSLGAPVPMDGYAVAFPVEPGCEVVDFTFAGNKPVLYSAIISGVASLALLVFAIVALVRRRGRVPREEPATPLPDPPTARVALRWALAWGVAAALVGAFVFALRAGVVIGPVVAFVLWRGIDAKRLAVAAGGLLAIVVPILYLAVPIRDRGGYSTSAPMDRIAAHWVAVAAIVLLLLALYRAVAGVKAERARRPSTSTPPAARH
jgi:hypothetical protein